ncbi:hypothetical protein AAC387_Pa11g1290 [Persea americana]
MVCALRTPSCGIALIRKSKRVDGHAISPTCFYASSIDLGITHLVFHGRSCKKNFGVTVSVWVRVSDSQLKENWLDSQSYPITKKWSHPRFHGEEADNVATSEYHVIGIDPDISGVLAVLNADGLGSSA